MNKRQRKKAYKKWLATAVYIEEQFSTYEPINVGFSAFMEEMRRLVAEAFAVPPHMLFGHRLGGYAPRQLLIGWDGPR